MEINLLLTAKRLQLAPTLDVGEAAGGLAQIKNITERTYLAVTPLQWKILQQFSEPQTVPTVLERAIEDRLCPPLGEFYELVLKAVRNRILVEPGHRPVVVAAINWVVSLRPAKLRIALWLFFLTGLALTAALEPEIPANTLDFAASTTALLLAWITGLALSASLLRGSGGEVYATKQGLLSLTDTAMLAPRDQQVVLLAPIATLSAMTGFLAWHRPEWSLLPLLALLATLRPVLRARINRMIRSAANPRLSDSEHSFLFPPNRTPRARWRLIKFGLGHPATWKEIGYGVVWTLTVGYFFGVLTEVPPWTLAFWQDRGPWLLLTIAGSLSAFGTVYLSSEFYLYLRERAIARRETLRQWYRRWFQRSQISTDADARLSAVHRSPVMRLLSPPDRSAIAAEFKAASVSAWRVLQAFDADPDHVSFILSGKVGVYRRLPSGRRILMQVLAEDDLVGLHGLADPTHPVYLYRTLTPVVLLQLDIEAANRLLLPGLTQKILTNLVLKLPFLKRLRLCQNWHVQAIQRFAELSNLEDCDENEVILQEGSFSEVFHILLEGQARVFRRDKPRGIVKGGDFFGEIGLLQNSNATAKVVAKAGARTLSIRRREFLRFVTHNYSVALELERVSSERLGHPIFPLKPGNFKTI